MATNEVFHEADNLSLPVPADTASGTPVIVGGLVGVTETAEGEGGNPAGKASVRLAGARTVPVTGAITAVGQPVYIPTAGGALTATSTSNVLWGHALETKASGTAPIVVRITAS